MEQLTSARSLITRWRRGEPKPGDSQVPAESLDRSARGCITGRVLWGCKLPKKYAVDQIGPSHPHVARWPTGSGE